jgi:hypothetical protein
MGLMRDVMRGFGMGIGFKLADEAYKAAKKKVGEELAKRDDRQREAAFADKVQARKDADEGKKTDAWAEMQKVKAEGRVRDVRKKL